jgi:hypothetical protein
MTDDDLKQVEQRGYSRGYAAGQRRLDRENAREEASGRRERFRQDVYLAIVSQMIASPWGRKVDGRHVPDKNAQEISASAWRFADEAVKRATFL